MKEQIKPALVAGFILLLVSCKVTQPYIRPVDSARNRSYRGAPGAPGAPGTNTTGVQATPADSNTIANMPWNQLFTDTLLQGLIREGIARNPDLQIAIARIKSASANARQSRLALLPRVDANATASFQRVPDTQFGFPETYQLYVNTSWEADVWGKLSSAKRASLALLLASEAYKRAVQTQLIADIATDYYTLLAYDAQLQVTELTVENRKKEVETMKSLKDGDVVTGAAVVQSAANRYSVEITIPDLKLAIRETENALSILLGRNADTINRSSLDSQTMISDLATGIPAQLLANRPDVQEAEYQLRNAFELVNVARTYFYPAFTITGSAGYSSTSLTQLFNPVSLFANITGGLLQPIFEQGANKQRLRVAQANREEFLNAFSKTILTAGQEVSNALYSYRTAVEKEALRSEQIAYLQKAVDYTKELLKYSSSTNYTDVLTSEQGLLSAQLSSINDRLQQLTAVVSLYKSLGGGTN